MAKKKSKTREEEPPAATPEVVDAEDGDDDEVELLQVDLGDMIKMKQVLDEGVAAAVLEHLEEDYRWDNFKLILMAVACLFAMIAQFAPLPFPESRPVLGVCGSAYFVLSGVLQFITTFIDKDTILLTKAQSSTSSSKNANLQAHGVRVRSNLPRFSEWYSVVLEFKLDDEKSDDKKNATKSTATPEMYVEERWSVGQFFDKEGYFDEVGLAQQVDKLYARFEKMDYEKAATDKKKD